MNVVQTAPNGVVNELTVFSFTQIDDIVTANYAGGKVVKGYLVGLMEKDNLKFSYCQLQDDGKLDNGQSDCEIIMSDDGKIQLIEKFKWASRNGDTGINIFREI